MTTTLLFQKEARQRVVVDNKKESKKTYRLQFRIQTCLARRNCREDATD